MIICITGMPGAGKSVVAGILKGRGYRVYELGDIVRDEMRARKVAANSKAEKEFSIYLRKRYGKDITARLLVKRAGIRQNSKTIIAGFRSKADLDYVKGHFKVITIAVVAPAKTRFSRTRMRMRPQDPKTMADFVRDRDKKEARFGILGVIKNADYVISNTGTLADLRKSVMSVAKDAGLF